MGSDLPFGFCDGRLEGVGGEDVSVDGDDLLAGGEFGFVGGAVPADVGDGAVGADAEAEGVPDVEAGSSASSVGGRWCARSGLGLSV